MFNPTHTLTDQTDAMVMHTRTHTQTWTFTLDLPKLVSWWVRNHEWTR